MFEAWTLRQDAVSVEDEQLRLRVRSLSDSQRADYFRIYNSRLKDPDTYAVLNWFFLTGLHHFYLGRILSGSVNLLVMVLGIVLSITLSPVGLMLIVFIVLVEIPALFRSQVIVQSHNINIGQAILESIDLTSKSNLDKQ